jgi:hypothetical protein
MLVEVKAAEEMRQLGKCVNFSVNHSVVTHAFNLLRALPPRLYAVKKHWVSILHIINAYVKEDEKVWALLSEPRGWQSITVPKACVGTLEYLC